MAEIREKKVIDLVNYWDAKLFFLVNKNMRNYFLNIFMPIITQLGNGFLTLALSGLFFYGVYRVTGVKETETMVLIVAVAIFSTIVVHVLKNIFNRERPAKGLDGVLVLGPVLRFSSFPSGHTVSAFALAAVLAAKFAPLALVFYGVAFLVGLSRVYVGAHYPLDVFVGSLLGVASAKVVLLAAYLYW